MASYNANSPSSLGMEWRPTIQEDKKFSGVNQGIAMRIMPGAVTLDALYPFLKSVEGNPGIAVEVLSSIEKPVAAQTSLADGKTAMGEHHFIGTDTGLVSAGWKRLSDNSTVAANLRGALDEFPALTTAAETIVNSAALTPSTKLVFAGRGNDTALTGKRITAVEIVCFHRTIAGSGATRSGTVVKGYLNLGGVVYYGRTHTADADSKWRQPAVGYWTQNPSTNKPWTLAEVNALVSTTASDEFGIEVGGATVPPGSTTAGYHLSEIVMVVFTTGTTGSGAVGDVRKGFYYQQESPSAGWNAFTLGSTSAESASTYYYVHVYPLSASGSFIIPILKDPRPSFTPTTSASATGEHRIAYLTTLGPGGVIQSYEAMPGAMFPILESVAGTFQSQSQAYAELANLDEDTNSTANLAQQVTTTGGTPPTYKSIRVPLGWAGATEPTAPLNIQIQHGASAPTGGGTVLASIYVQPNEVTQQVADRSVSLGSAGVAPPAATKLFVLIDSAAAAATGWKIGRLDTRSDAIPASTPTVANIEGQSQGGQTDSQSYGATDFDRYDIPLALVGDPGQVGGTPAPAVPTLTATVEAGA